MTTTTFGATGQLARLRIPADIDVISLVATGGAGVPAVSYDINAGVALAGGRGARVSARVPVTGGEELWIAVGQVGDADDVALNGAPFGRGGKRGGGAATIVGRGAVILDNAILVAAGGGGGGEDGTGGDGGGTGSRSAGTGGGGLGGGQDPTWTAPDGEDAIADGCAGGGGGVRGGRAGTVGANDKRGGGGGGSSRTPVGGAIAPVAQGSTGAGNLEVTYGLAPYASRLLSPGLGDVVAAGRDVNLQWAFVGASTLDVQDSAEVTYTTPAGSFTASIDGPGDTVTVQAILVQTGPIAWSVITRGAGSPPSPAARGTFTAAPAPADPDITAPTSGAIATAPDVVLRWAAADQSAYRVRRLSSDGARVLFDTGIVPDAGARSLTVRLDANRRTELLTIAVRGASGAWSREATTTVSTSYQRPAVPTVTATPDPDTASLIVTVSHVGEGGRPAAVRESLEVDCSAPEGRHGILTDADRDGVRRWRLPASGVDYVVVATAYDEAGVPAIGVSEAEPEGWGVTPWGAGPWGD